MPSFTKLIQAISDPLTNRLRARSRAKRLHRAPFYEKYPYRHELPLATCDARGAIDVERRFFFNRVPKSANTTVTGRLAELKFKRVVSAHEARAAFVRPSELTAHEVAEFEGFFKFTIVRNPYARAFSAYTNKIVGGRKLDYMRRAGSPGPAPSFLEFCEYLQRGGLYENAHWAPQVSLMLIPVDRFDLIGRLETLNEAWSSIVERIEPGSARVSAERPGAKSAPSEGKPEAHYDERSADIIRKLYRRDFETFGYSMQVLYEPR